MHPRHELPRPRYPLRRRAVHIHTNIRAGKPRHAYGTARRDTHSPHQRPQGCSAEDASRQGDNRRCGALLKGVRMGSHLTYSPLPRRILAPPRLIRVRGGHNAAPKRLYGLLPHSTHIRRLSHQRVRPLTHKRLLPGIHRRV